MSISEKKQKLIDEFLSTPLKVGDKITVDVRSFTDFLFLKSPKKEFIIKSIRDKEITALITEYGYNDKEYTFSSDLITGRNFVDNIGANPFKKNDKLETYKIDIQQLLYRFELYEKRHEDCPVIMNGHQVEEINWNPFVIINGKKEYYQRPFVWSLKDKQLLIDSIYNGIECGIIVVRLRSWEWLENAAKKGEQDLFFKDVVDGKQRAHTIGEFVNNKFADSHGNFFSDLSTISQRHFLNQQSFLYAELNENTSDENTIMQFLKTNFAGIPQTQEHIDFVNSLYSKF